MVEDELREDSIYSYVEPKHDIDDVQWGGQQEFLLVLQYMPIEKTVFRNIL